MSIATATVIAAASSSLSATVDAGHMQSLSFALPCCWSASFSHRNFTAAARGRFPSRITSTRVSCEVAIRSDSHTASSSSSSNSSVADVSPEDAAASSKIGARVRVKVPLKVHHVPRVAEVDITGLEGELKQYVALWKGKRISANLPYKVQFIVDVQGRGAVKFFAHLKEDEFDYI